MADKEYGLTLSGPNIKRLDDIVEELHDDLSEGWGVNTRNNPQSLLNVLITNFADKIAELWELAEAIYHSQYPSSAEGISLDNAAQLGGSTRKPATKSLYPIHCTGIDGTVLEAESTIASNTNPPVNLSISEEKLITRESCNKAKIKVVSVTVGAQYRVIVNGTAYAYTALSDDDENDILDGINTAMTNDSSRRFSNSVDEDESLLCIDMDNIAESAVVVLEGPLTTENVTTIITFATVETGDIQLPSGSITEIINADIGLEEVINLTGYTPGNDEETDTEFRQSYIDKIFNRSSMMLESIRSSLLENVQGVKSVAVYENDTNEDDAETGRPAHSIEVVVDGGNDNEIAQEILDNKAGGISTYGSQSVNLTTDYDDTITIRFSRPSILYVWFNVVVTKISESASLPDNWETLIKNVIVEKFANLNTGDDVIPQQFINDMYAAIPSGISYIDISLFTSEKNGPYVAVAALDVADIATYYEYIDNAFVLTEDVAIDSEKTYYRAITDEDYAGRTATVTARQRAFTDATMITVGLPS